MVGRAKAAWAGSIALAGLGLAGMAPGRPAARLAEPPAELSIVNFESPHVHPLDWTPDTLHLLACNTAANQLEVYTIDGAGLTEAASIPVGMDPVTVRARTNTEVWVLNHVSDSISIVDLTSMNAVRTIKTLDEPWDVVFAGSPQRAFVSCTGGNTVQVFDPADLDAPAVSVAIDGEMPRGLAVSPDGSKVYVAIFESGNATTILGGGVDTTQVHGNISFPANVVSDPTGPYGGQNPPPNSGTSFSPPINPLLPPPPKVGLIVRKNAAGQWMDDNNHDWTAMVSGADAAKSGRPVGWDMPDRDVGVIDTGTLGVTYATGLMNLCMGIAVNPASGAITVVGTEAQNQIRYEPKLSGKFIQVEMATVDPADLSNKTIVDLNPHLDYLSSTIAETERDKSVGDPRAVVWNSAGTKGYVAGLGSSNVVVINPAGARVGLAPTVIVGEGPTGLVLDEGRGFLYVLSRFQSSVTVIELASETGVQTLGMFDPTPEVVKRGRAHLFSTHRQSGLGQISCASCHVDARTDRLAWDLGDPTGSMRSLTGINKGFGVPLLEPGTTSPAFASHHPMKGPMVTQTLQDIIGHEPLHWRGDRTDLHEFLDAFQSLQGAVYTADMDEFEHYLSTVTFPPDPYRAMDNTLPTALDLAGHVKTGRFGANAGQPLGTGNAINGRDIFRNPVRKVVGGRFACATCHTTPTGLGADGLWNGGSHQPIAADPGDIHHIGAVSVAGVTNITMKIPQLRNLQHKTGFSLSSLTSNVGFGYGHDGSIDSLERFVNMDEFQLVSDQETADMVAFLLAFSGSGLPLPSTGVMLLPPGPTSRDVPASVGVQLTLAGPPDSGEAALLSQMVALVETGKVSMIAQARVGGVQRGYAYVSGGLWQADMFGQQLSDAQVLALAGPGSELSYMIVPAGTEIRLAIDRDLDGCLNGDEGLNCTCIADFDLNTFVNGDDFDYFMEAFFYGNIAADVDGNTFVNGDDFDLFMEHFYIGC